MIEDEEKFLGELRMGRMLTGVGMAAIVGLTVYPGLFLLIGGRVAGHLGVKALTAALLMLFLLGFTLLNILELFGGSGERGGSYSLIQESLGGLSGFLAGWFILAGNLVLTAAFAQLAGGLLRFHLEGTFQAPWAFGLGILGLLIIVQVFRLVLRQEWGFTLALVLFLSLGAVLITVLPSVDRAQYQIIREGASNQVLLGAAWLVTAYAGLEALLASRRQVYEAGHRLPKALGWVMGGAGLLMVLGVLILAGLPLRDDLIPLSIALSDYSFLPSWSISGLGLLAAVLATNSTLMASARQLHSLSRRGALPRVFRRMRAPFRLPPMLFAFMAVILVPLIIVLQKHQLVDMAAGFFLVPILFLNIAAISSRRTEPDRRRPFMVPFYPLVPAIALGLALAMLVALPSAGLVGAATWLIVGLALYWGYGRAQQVEAQEGEQVFGRGPDREKEPGTYRILVPVSADVERHTVLEIAIVLARQMNAELIPLQVIPMSDPLAMEQGKRVARERNMLFQWSVRFAAKSGVSLYPITRLARSVHDGILETAAEEQCDLILLSWLVESAARGVHLGPVLDPVVQRAQCDVVVLGLHADYVQKIEKARAAALEAGAEEGAPILPIDRILVTTAGGPHAPLATRLAVLLAREYDATAQTVYVTDPQASPEVIAEGEARIRETHAAMRRQAEALPTIGEPEEALLLESRVIPAEGVLKGIVQAGAESDLVLIGASEESLIDQVLLGNLPEEVARACPSPVLMTKRYLGLRRFWLQRLWDALYDALPSLSKEEMVEVYKRVRRSARPDIDYFIMMGLSATIATYGLLQDSSAVIIGAMLVAPLFTPILALSLAIVQGDIYLLRLAVEAGLKGIALAIGLGILITVFSPLRTLGHEIVARVQPNLFDLAVALASGAAGAYAIARKDVAAALPGVAIAAALVPPLGVVGVGLAIQNPQVAGGGGLLFLTNLVAIVLAGSITLLLLGFRPTQRMRRAARLRLGLATSMVLLIIVAVPLAVVFVRSVRESGTRNRIETVLNQQMDADSNLELLDFDFQDQEDRVDITARLYTQKPITQELNEIWRLKLHLALERPVTLRIVSIPVFRVESSSP